MPRLRGASRTTDAASRSRRLDELAALTQVTQAVGASLNLEQTLGSISTHAARLTRSDTALIFLYNEDEDVLSVRASYSAPAGYLAEIGERRMPRGGRATPPDGSLTVRAVVERAPAQVADVDAAREYVNRDLLLRWGFRAVLVVPLIWGEQVIGAMSVLRKQPGKFTRREVQLVVTFASHSAIALAHARLFREAQDQNRALRQALERQTLTAEFLRAVSGTFELQPILDTLVEHATRFCAAASGFIFTLRDGAYHLAAAYKAPDDFRALMERSPVRPGRATVIGRTALGREPVHIPDVVTDAEYGWAEAQRLGGYRTALGVPLLHEGQPIGVIAVWRTEVQPFTREEIEALCSFADQAVLAIEKIRLFREVQRRTEELARLVEELRALSRTTQAVNSSLDLERVLAAIAEQACTLCEGDSGLITELVEETGEFVPCAGWQVRRELMEAIRRSAPTWGNGATGRSALLRGAVQMPDILADTGYRWRELLSREGYRAVLSVPLLRDGRAIGTIAVARRAPGPFADRHVQLLTTFADQATIALEHARLFRQLQEKAAQLEIVSRHKSQFLASMSHELRTPLNAIIGFSEVLLDPGLAPQDDQERQEFLSNILTSGRHLLRLINDVLDLSKVEAGKLEFEPEPVSLRDVVDGVLAMIRPLAAKQRVQVVAELPDDLPPGWADPPRLKQILFNLVSNAIKFTPQGGAVTVGARTIADCRLQIADWGNLQSEISNPKSSFLEVSVTDTGIGIPPEHQDRIFEEFEQVAGPGGPGQEGTGLGLALVKRLVALHGGRIRVESSPGRGSTFAFTIPAAPMPEGDAGQGHVERSHGWAESGSC